MRFIAQLVTVTLLFMLVAGCNRGQHPNVSQSTPDSPNAGQQSDAQNSTEPREMVEHPTYKLWGQFPVGTSVTKRTTTDSELTPGQTITTIVYTIKERSDDHVVIESQATTTYHGGRVDTNPPSSVRTPRWIQLPPGIKKEEWGKEAGGAQAGDEVVTVGGKPYSSRWRKSRSTTDAGEMITTTWTSTQMPGGLVKSVSQVPAVKETTTIEVIEVKIP
jgi:hypothetical protein